jgi:hypothetical protein
MDFFAHPKICSISNPRGTFDVRVPGGVDIPMFKRYIAWLCGVPPDDCFDCALLHDRSRDSIHDANYHNVGQLLAALPPDCTLFPEIVPRGTPLDSCRMVTVLVAKGDYTISAQFRTIFFPGRTFRDLFNVACEYGFLSNNDESFLRCLYQCEKEDIEGEAELRDGLEPEFLWIRLEVIPRDQRNLSSYTEKLCQIVFVKPKARGELSLTGFPSLFKLTRAETAESFKTRLRTEFAASKDMMESQKLWLDPVAGGRVEILGPDVPFEILDAFPRIVVELAGGTAKKPRALAIRS